MATHERARDLFEDQFDAFRAGMRKLIDKADPHREPSRLRALASRAEQAVKAHPIAAVGIALGLGYAIVRIVRR